MPDVIVYFGPLELALTLLGVMSLTAAALAFWQWRTNKKETEDKAGIVLNP